MKRRHLFWLGTAILTVAATAAAIVYRANHVPTIAVYAVKRQELVQTVVASGRVRAPAKISIGPLTGGQVTRLAVDDGQEVREGQLLLLLDDAEARALASQAEAAVAQSEARLRQLSEFDAKVTTEGLKQAVINLEQSEKDFQRMQNLERSGLVTRAELEDAQQKLGLARSLHQSALLQSANMAPEGSERRQASAALAQSRAAMQAAEVRLAHSRVTSPVRGVVLSHSVEMGDTVQAGQQALLLARHGETQLVVEPDEKNLAFLKLGQKALASADAFPDRSFPAEVSFIAPSVDLQRGTVELRLSVPNPPDYLRPDMTVSVDIEVGRRRDALVLPADAVRDGGSLAPWVVAVRDGVLQRCPVKTGLRAETIVEILAGLSDGDLAVPLASGAPEVGRRVNPLVVEAK